MTLYLEGQQVATILAGRRAELELARLGPVIQGLFDDAQRCTQAREADEARDALLVLKQRLLERLAGCATELSAGLG